MQWLLTATDYMDVEAQMQYALLLTCVMYGLCQKPDCRLYLQTATFTSVYMTAPQLQCRNSTCNNATQSDQSMNDTAVKSRSMSRLSAYRPS